MALTLFDNGFESRSDGTSLDDSIWTESGSPQNAEYDTSQAKVGTVSLWLKGPTGAAYGTTYTYALSGARTDGVEFTFWAYFDTTNQMRSCTGENASDSAVYGTHWFRWYSDGTLGCYTSKSGVTGYTKDAYTQVSTYTTGWMQYRVVLNFSTNTYLFYERADSGSSWTPLKSSGASDYNIPMRGSGTVKYFDRLSFNAYQDADLWIDDLYFDSKFSVVANGWEDYADGDSLAKNTGVWVGATATRAEHDTTYAKIGSKSAWVCGSTSGHMAMVEHLSGGRTTDGCELRWWFYADTMNAGEIRYFDDGYWGVDRTVNSCFHLALYDDGTVKAFTSKAGNPNGYTTGVYVSVGTFSTGTWTQFRIVFDFTNQRYTLYQRTDPSHNWTVLTRTSPTDNYIPMRGTATLTRTNGTWFRNTGTADQWIDDIEYDNGFSGRWPPPFLVPNSKLS